MEVDLEFVGFVIYYFKELFSLKIKFCSEINCNVFGDEKLRVLKRNFPMFKFKIIKF
jgi:hypothetical protein